MKSISAYSARFLAIEIFSYLLLVVPWLGGLLGLDLLRYGLSELFLKAGLSAAIVVFILLLRDVRRKMQALDLLKKNLSLAAIHDLKGPLTAMIGALQVMEDHDIDAEIRDKLMVVAMQGSRDMQKLIQILLDTDRMEISRLVLQHQSLAPGKLIAEVAERFKPVAEVAGIQFSVHVPEDLPDLRADRDLIYRVFENLLLNAFKYSRRGGRVEVSAAFGEGRFRFKISDTGQGIAPEHVKKVFDKYFRVEGQESLSRKGSGIGLYFCRLAVEAHGGTIVIDSRLGTGTSVSFELPAVREEVPSEV